MQSKLGHEDLVYSVWMGKCFLIKTFLILWDKFWAKDCHVYPLDKKSLIKMLITNEMQGVRKVHVPGVIYNHLVSGFVLIIFLSPVILK